jgi:hypothetical protein
LGDAHHPTPRIPAARFQYSSAVADHPVTALLDNMNDVLAEMTARQGDLVESLRTIRLERFGPDQPVTAFSSSVVAPPRDAVIRPAVQLRAATPVDSVVTESVEPNTAPLLVAGPGPVAPAVESAPHPAVTPQPIRPVPATEPGHSRNVVRDYDFFADLDAKLALLAEQQREDGGSPSDN